jgi:hypothetical protein
MNPIILAAIYLLGVGYVEEVRYKTIFSVSS